MIQLNLFGKKTCVHCGENPGPDPRNTFLWFGFVDMETKELVCWKCSSLHYQIKSENGTKDFTIVEMPVYDVHYSEYGK